MSSYSKQTWHDSPTADTPLSAARLGHIEDGIDNATTKAEAAITPASAHAATSKTSPVDADEIPGLDSAGSFGGVKFTFATIKAWIKTWIAKADVGLGNVTNNAQYYPGGTDVAITDGGTGVSTLPSGLLKGAGTGAISAAAANTDYVTPAGLSSIPHATTAKTTPVFGDEIVMLDSATSFAVVKVLVSDFITGIATYIAGVAMQMSNKAIIPRVGGTTSIGTISFDVTLTDMVILTAMAVPVTSIVYTGTAVDGQEVTLRFKDNGTARAIAHGSQFIAGPGGALLTTTVINKTHLEKFRFDLAAAKFVLIFRDATGY